MNDVQSCFIDLVKNVIFDVELSKSFKSCNLAKLYELSKKQDMAHIIAFGLKKNNLIDLNSDLWKKHYKKQFSLAQYRITNLQYEYSCICRVFEENNIDYIPLKGAVIRLQYPEAWMRMSCDIDILIFPKDQKKAHNLLTNILGCKVIREISHHDQIKTKSGFILELHLALTSGESDVAMYLHDVWSRSNKVDNTNHQYMMDDSLFYFYHIFHAAKHFKGGGCGIKTLVDTWIINNKLNLNLKSCYDDLKKYNLIKFAEMLEFIAQKYFSEMKLNSSDMVKYTYAEEYIFSGGIYGGENFAAAQSGGNKNIIIYCLKRAFPSYKFMSLRYRNISIKFFLLPYYWFKRIGTAFNEKNKKQTQQEIKKALFEKEKIEKINIMFKELDL